VPAQRVQVRAESGEGSLRRAIPQVHVRDGGEVDIGPLELPDRGAQDQAPLVWRPCVWQLEDSASHVSKLGGSVLGLREESGQTCMDDVWVSGRSITLGRSAGDELTR
jgi:hypothetical protein